MPNKGILVLVVIAALVGGVACDTINGVAKFTVVATNRTPNTIEVYVNGGVVGAVGAGRVESFTTKQDVLYRGYGSYNGPSDGQIVVNARDTRTGKVTRPSNFVVRADQKIEVTYEPYHFQ